MYYKVDVTRIGYSYATFGVEAKSEAEAREKAYQYAQEEGYWGEDDMEFEVDKYPREITEEEYNEEFA